MRSPNIVLFITHDTGQHVSPYGYRTVDTPHCERLAAEGVMFRRSFCTSPLCSPSRAAIVTGRHPHQTGVQGLTGEQLGGFDLDPAVPHAAQLLADAGYESVLCGFQHEARECLNLGFHRLLNGCGSTTNGGGDSRDHAPALDAWLGQRPDSAPPFYLQIGCHETHLRWDAGDTPPDDRLGVHVPDWLNDTPEVRRELAQFQGAVRRMDQLLGQVLDVLERHGVLDETIFVFTTDHGADLPRAKGTFYDAGLETFLFMRYPAGGWGAGRVIEPMVSNVDLLPTLLEACGLDIPEGVAGRSMLPLLRGESYEPRRTIFAEKTFHDFYDPTRALRTDRFKYIRYFEANIHQDLRAGTLDRRHWFRDPAQAKRPGIEELYDLAADPGETRDLSGDPAHRGTLEHCRRELAAWMRRTDDPLLDGPIESPHFRRQREALAALAPRVPVGGARTGP